MLVTFLVAMYCVFFMVEMSALQSLVLGANKLDKSKLLKCIKIQKYLNLFFYCSIVVYEGGSVMSQARSLWRLELARTKWSGGFINWYHPMRFRHLTTGRYLGVNENNELILVN